MHQVLQENMSVHHHHSIIGHMTGLKQVKIWKKKNSLLSDLNVWWTQDKI